MTDTQVAQGLANLAAEPGGGILTLPPGLINVYTGLVVNAPPPLTSALSLAGGVTIRGAGKNATVLRGSKLANLLTIAAGNRDVTLEDLTIYDPAPSTGNGIHVIDSLFVRLRRVAVVGFAAPLLVEAVNGESDYGMLEDVELGCSDNSNVTNALRFAVAAGKTIAGWVGTAVRCESAFYAVRITGAGNFARNNFLRLNAETCQVYWQSSGMTGAGSSQDNEVSLAHADGFVGLARGFDTGAESTHNEWIVTEQLNALDNSHAAGTDKIRVVGT